MAGFVKVTIIRLVIAIIGLLDRVASFFGYTIFKFSLEGILKSLPQEAVDAATDPQIVTPLGIFCKSMEKDKDFNAVNRFAQTSIIKNSLRKRAMISRCLKQYPEIKETPITRPIFIIGFPRTGTTLLYNLLAQDSQFMAPMFWELLTPCGFPPGRPDNWRESKRFLDVQNILEMHQAAGAEFDVAHEIRAENPEECQFALGRSFFQYHYFLRMKAFQSIGEWFYDLTRKEKADIYTYYKTQLQMIGYNSMHNRRYMLKSHNHLIGLDSLLDVFPDACLVFTYRPLTEIVPSFCSTIYKATSTWTKMDDGYGKRVVRMIGEFANRSVEVMKTYEGVPAEKQPFYNIEYRKMVADPIATIKDIYSQYGLDLTVEAEGRMRNYMTSHPQHRHGKHTYSMKEYNITEQDLRDNFGPYLEYFKDKSDKLI